MPYLLLVVQSISSFFSVLDSLNFQSLLSEKEKVVSRLIFLFNFIIWLYRSLVKSEKFKTNRSEKNEGKADNLAPLFFWVFLLLDVRITSILLWNSEAGV